MTFVSAFSAFQKKILNDKFKFTFTFLVKPKKTVFVNVLITRLLYFEKTNFEYEKILLNSVNKEKTLFKKYFFWSVFNGEFIFAVFILILLRFL